MVEEDIFEQLSIKVYSHLKQKKDLNFKIDGYDIYLSFQHNYYSFRIVLEVLKDGTLQEKIFKVNQVIAQNASILGVFETVLGYNKKNNQLFLQECFGKVTHYEILEKIEKALQHADILLQKMAIDD